MAIARNSSIEGLLNELDGIVGSEDTLTGTRSRGNAAVLRRIPTVLWERYLESDFTGIHTAVEESISQSDHDEEEGPGDHVQDIPKGSEDGSEHDLEVNQHGNQGQDRRRDATRDSVDTFDGVVGQDLDQEVQDLDMNLPGNPVEASAAMSMDLGGRAQHTAIWSPESTAAAHAPHQPDETSQQPDISESSLPSRSDHDKDDDSVESYQSTSTAAALVRLLEKRARETKSTKGPVSFEDILAQVSKLLPQTSAYHDERSTFPPHEGRAEAGGQAPHVDGIEQDERPLDEGVAEANGRSQSPQTTLQSEDDEDATTTQSRRDPVSQRLYPAPSTQTSASNLLRHRSDFLSEPHSWTKYQSHKSWSKELYRRASDRGPRAWAQLFAESGQEAQGQDESEAEDAAAQKGLGMSDIETSSSAEPEAEDPGERTANQAVSATTSDVMPCSAMQAETRCETGIRIEASMQESEEPLSVADHRTPPKSSPVAGEGLITASSMICQEVPECPHSPQEGSNISAGKGSPKHKVADQAERNSPAEQGLILIAEDRGEYDDDEDWAFRPIISGQQVEVPLYKGEEEDPQVTELETPDVDMDQHVQEDRDDQRVDGHDDHDKIETGDDREETLLRACTPLDELLSTVSSHHGDPAQSPVISQAAQSPPTPLPTADDFTPDPPVSPARPQTPTLQEPAMDAGLPLSSPMPIVFPPSPVRRDPPSPSTPRHSAKKRRIYPPPRRQAIRVENIRRVPEVVGLEARIAAFNENRPHARRPYLGQENQIPKNPERRQVAKDKGKAKVVEVIDLTGSAPEDAAQKVATHRGCGPLAIPVARHLNRVVLAQPPLRALVDTPAFSQPSSITSRPSQEAAWSPACRSTKAQQMAAIKTVFARRRALVKKLQWMEWHEPGGVKKARELGVQLSILRHPRFRAN